MKIRSECRTLNWRHFCVVVNCTVLRTRARSMKYVKILGIYEEILTTTQPIDNSSTSNFVYLQYVSHNFSYQ